MKIELAQDGYGKIDRIILEIENSAYSGLFTNHDRALLMQKIVSDVKLLRQALREVLLLVPDKRPVATNSEGGAA